MYLFGKLVSEPVDHPMIRPSINAVAETYDLARTRRRACICRVLYYRAPGESVFAHCRERSRFGDAKQDAAKARTEHGDMFSALRGDGCS